MISIPVTPLPSGTRPGSIVALQRRLAMTRRTSMNIMRELRPGFRGRMPASSLEWIDAQSRVRGLKEQEAALRYQIRKRGMGLKATPQLGGGGMTVGQVGRFEGLGFFPGMGPMPSAPGGQSGVTGQPGGRGPGQGGMPVPMGPISAIAGVLKAGIGFATARRVGKSRNRALKKQLRIVAMQQAMSTREAEAMEFQARMGMTAAQFAAQQAVQKRKGRVQLAAIGGATVLGVTVLALALRKR